VVHIRPRCSGTCVGLDPQSSRWRNAQQKWEVGMAEAIVRFQWIVQDSQDLGSDDEHMTSRVYFGLETDDGRSYPDLMCFVKQAVGAPFEQAPLEVGRPKGYDGSLDYEPFRQAVEDYYRDSFGSRGRAIHIGAGVKNVRMRDNRVHIEKNVRVEYSSRSIAW
jgi:hypothetical protein